MKYLQLGLAFLLFTACNSNNNKAPQNDIQKATDTSNAHVIFFPVADYIKSQVHLADSLKLLLIKIVIKEKDSIPTSLSQQEFIKIAEQFYEPDISSAELKPQYKETAFADQSIPSITLTYTTTNTSLEIQRLDVLIKPDPVQSDKVRSIYIEKSFNKGDTSFSKKLYWKADKNCQVITTAQVNNEAPVTSVEKISWSGE